MRPFFYYYLQSEKDNFATKCKKYDIIDYLCKEIEKLYNKLPLETLIIVIADHGHVECKYKTLSENKELFKFYPNS